MLELKRGPQETELNSQRLLRRMVGSMASSNASLSAMEGKSPPGLEPAFPAETSAFLPSSCERQEHYQERSGGISDPTRLVIIDEADRFGEMAEKGGNCTLSRHFTGEFIQNWLLTVQLRNFRQKPSQTPNPPNPTGKDIARMLQKGFGTRDQTLSVQFFPNSLRTPN